MEFVDASSGSRSDVPGATGEDANAQPEVKAEVEAGAEADVDEEVCSPSLELGGKDITAALRAKEEGNVFFRDKDWDGAVTLYSQAIGLCPDDEANRDNLAVFLGNRAAAYFNLDEFTLVVEDCTLALEAKEDYVKVLARRMQALERLERTDEALQDARRIQELDPAWPKIAPTVARLEKESADKMEKMKEEALGKLKDIGNSILGNFGMSLDNFKFKQDEKVRGIATERSTGLRVHLRPTLRVSSPSK